MQSSSSIVSALKNYNASLLLSIFTASLVGAFALLFYSDVATNPDVLIALGIAIICLHSCSVFNFYQAITKLHSTKPWLIVPYLLLPLGNLFILFELCVLINVRLEEIEQSANQGTMKAFSIRRVYKLANVKVIEQQLYEIERNTPPF